MNRLAAKIIRFVENAPVFCKRCGGPLMATPNRMYNDKTGEREITTWTLKCNNHACVAGFEQVVMARPGWVHPSAEDTA